MADSPFSQAKQTYPLNVESRRHPRVHRLMGGEEPFMAREEPFIEEPFIEEPFIIGSEEPFIIG